MKTYTITTDDKDYIFYVGENAIENWKMLTHAKQWYYFFHLSSFPSGYGMLVCNNIEDIPRIVLKQCARYIIQNSKQRNLRNVKVDCTKYYNVKRGDKVGEVMYKRSRDVQVLF